MADLHVPANARTWTARRGFHNASRWILIAVIAAVSVWIVREAAIHRSPATLGYFLLLIPVSVFCWTRALPAVKVTVSDEGLWLQGFLTTDERFSWDEIRVVESHPEFPPSTVPAIFFLFHRNVEGELQALNIGGPRLRVQTGSEDMWVSCPDPDAVLDEVLRHRPDLVSAVASEPTPERGPRVAHSSLVSWRTAARPLFGNRTVSVVIQGLVFAAGILAYAVGESRSGDSRPAWALPALAVLVPLALYLKTRESRTLEISVDAAGISLKRGSLQPRTWTWDEITDVRVKRASEFTWADSNLRGVGFGTGFAYFGGDAVEMTTTAGRIPFSAPDPEAVSAEIERHIG